MTDILVELLPQQPVLGLQPGVLSLQRNDTRTQFFNFFEQRGVGHTSLTTVQLFLFNQLDRIFQKSFHRRYQFFFARTSSP